MKHKYLFSLLMLGYNPNLLHSAEDRNEVLFGEQPSKTQTENLEPERFKQKTFFERFTNPFKGKSQPKLSQQEPKRDTKNPVQLDKKTFKNYQKLQNQIKKLDTIIGTNTNIRSSIEKYFPITEYSKLIDDIIKNKSIPVDIDQRIESIVLKLYNTQDKDHTEITKAITSAIKSDLLLTAKKQYESLTALDFGINTEAIQHTHAFITEILKILTDNNNPEKTLLKIHKAILESFKHKIIDDNVLQKYIHEQRIQNDEKQKFYENFFAILSVIAFTGVLNIIIIASPTSDNVDAQDFKRNILMLIDATSFSLLTLGVMFSFIEKTEKNTQANTQIPQLTEKNTSNAKSNT
ncbi:hypothetical protein KBD08_02280 [Candidatus Babeliales bacterium]|nr:hypothetical protein [Candidatus Babeliales bacterium]